MDLSPGSDSCNTDYLEIRNGGSPDSPILWRGCGNGGLSTSIRSMSNKVWIAFHSEANTERHRGFSLSAQMLTDGCGGIVHGEQGNITLPGSGVDKYPNNAECVWTLSGPSGHHIKIDFYDRFEIEDTAGCVNDYLLITNKDDAGTATRFSDPPLARLCGRNLPTSVNSTTSGAELTFRSDARTNGDGFKVRSA